MGLSFSLLRLINGIVELLLLKHWHSLHCLQVSFIILLGLIYGKPDNMSGIY